VCSVLLLLWIKKEEDDDDEVEEGENGKEKRTGKGKSEGFR